MLAEWALGWTQQTLPVVPPLCDVSTGCVLDGGEHGAGAPPGSSEDTAVGVFTHSGSGGDAPR